MPPSEYSGSSIQIPDEIVEWFAREMAGKCDGISVFDDECSMPANDATKALYRHDARDYLEEIGSRLYAHWAEVATDSRDGGALHRAGDVLRRAEHPGDHRDWADLPAPIREIYLQDAADVVAAALGFKVTPDGLAALGLGERT